MNERPETGADQVARELRAAGVARAYTCPGSEAIVPALRAAGISVTTACTVAGATAMAIVDTQASGGPAAVLAASPGSAVEAIPSMAVALSGRVPVIVVTVESDFGNAEFELPWFELRVGTHDQIRPLIRVLARFLGSEQRPALLRVTSELLASPVSISGEPALPSATAPVPSDAARPDASVAPTERELAQVLDALTSASCPLLLAGDGLSQSAATRLLELAVRGDIMVVGTPAARAWLDEGLARVLAPFGPYGPAAARQALIDADLVVVVGGLSTATDLGWIDSLQTERVISIAPEGSELGHARVAIGADPATFLAALLAAAPAIRGYGETRGLLLKDQYVDPSWTAADGTVHPADVWRAISARLDLRTTLVADDGPSAGWATRYARTRGGRRFVTSTGPGALGHGVRGGLGAWLAHTAVSGPGERVIVTTDAEGFIAGGNEVSTAVTAEAAITWVVFNRVAQERDLLTDNVLMARSLGADGIRVTCVEEMLGALAWALARSAPTVIDVFVDPGAVLDRYAPPPPGI